MGVPIRKPYGFSGKGRSVLKLKTKKEHDHQAALVSWIDHQFPNLCYTASAGGVHTSKSQGSKMKAAGYKKGTPDVQIFEPKGGYFGLFIEMKKEGGTTSADQIKFIAKLRARNYFAVVCTGSHEAIEVVSKYMAKDQTLFS